MWFFFTVVIRLLILTGLIPALSTFLGRLLSPFGFDGVWAQRLLTGALEISSGVWTLSGEGALAGRLSMAAFMLGWAGISVHCQVLSFLGNSGLSVRTYIAGKFLHGLFSAAFMAILVQIFPLGATVSSLLVEQVDDLAGLDFHTALTLSAVSAWITFLVFLLVAVVAIRKKPVHSRKVVV